MNNNEKFEINPCERCPLKDGYGGEYRCSICELTFLRKEYKRLKKYQAERKRLRNKLVKAHKEFAKQHGIEIKE